MAWKLHCPSAPRRSIGTQMVELCAFLVARSRGEHRSSWEGTCVGCAVVDRRWEFMRTQ